MAVSLRSLQVLFITPSILFALAVIMSVLEFQDKLLFVNIPRSLISLTSSRTVLFQYMHNVGKGYLFLSDSHDLTFFCVKIHLVALAPVMEFV